MINDRFKFLSILIVIVSVVGWLMFVFGMILLAFSLITPFEFGLGFEVLTISAPMSFLLMGGGIILVLFAENIRVLLAIEQNTRRINETYEKRSQRKPREHERNRDIDRGGEGLGSIVLKE